MPNVQKEWMNFSIVFVSAGITPGIYTPEYLLEKHIVDENWGWRVAGSNQLPELASVILYNQGKITLKIEKSKVTISEDVRSDGEIEASVLAQFAKNFLNASKHLAFVALGINFAYVVDDDNEDFLLDTFVLPDRIALGGHKISGLGMKFIFPYDGEGGALNLSLDRGVAKIVTPDSEVSHAGIIFQANFHRPFESPAGQADFGASLDSIGSNVKMLNEITDGIFGKNE